VRRAPDDQATVIQISDPGSIQTFPGIRRQTRFENGPFVTRWKPNVNYPASHLSQFQYVMLSHPCT
jgi:hypothetical protein